MYFSNVLVYSNLLYSCMFSFLQAPCILDPRGEQQNLLQLPPHRTINMKYRRPLCLRGSTTSAVGHGRCAVRDMLALRGAQGGRDGRDGCALCQPKRSLYTTGGITSAVNRECMPWRSVQGGLSAVHMPSGASGPTTACFRLDNP